MTLLIATSLSLSAKDTEKNFYNHSLSGNLYEVLWDNSIEEYSTVFGSQFCVHEDELFDVLIADDFIFVDETTVTGVFWTGGYLNCQFADGLKDYHFPWNITFFEDDGSGFHPGSVFAGPFNFPDSDILSEFLLEINNPDNMIWAANYIVELTEPIVFDSEQKYWITIYGYEDYFPQSIVAVHDESKGGIRLNEFNLKSQYWYDHSGYPSPDWFNVSEYEDVYDMNFMLLDYTINNAPNMPSCTYDVDNDEIVISSIDLDGDEIRYGVSWDNDENIDQWTEFFNSGEEVRVSCDGRKGAVGIIAEDVYGYRSDWVSVTSKSKILNNNLFEDLLSRFPILKLII
jgi:hypothetical protein